MNAEILKNIQICNQNHIKYANYIQKTIVRAFQVKICNEFDVLKSLWELELEQEKPLTVSYALMHVVVVDRN